MSVEIVTFDEIKPPEEGSSLGDPQVFQVKISNQVFAILAASPKTSGLEWKGQLDFANLETEALQGLSLSTGIKQMEDLQQTVRQNIDVMLIRREGDCDEVAEYKLGNGRDFARYQQSIRTTDNIVFAHYNYTAGNAHQSHHISLENHQLIEDAEIWLGRHHHTLLSYPFCEWVLNHHQDGDSIGNQLSGHQLADEINTFLAQFVNHS